jgi:hypothetical protein
MDTIRLNDWDEFEKKINELEASHRNLGPGFSSTHLFRGQRDANWKLQTTLERYADKKYSLLEYYRLTLTAQPQIETFTESSWIIPSYEEYEEWLREHEQLWFSDYKAYEYLAYLRHHGFPSPLLDWSRSPYVAAFFAFREESAPSQEVAVYVYQEYVRGGKVTSSGAPFITCLGPNVRSHKRHYLQQSQYTFCTNSISGEFHYVDHEIVVSRNESHQDLLFKYILPSSERAKALSRLNLMNINAFSLLGSEDSLMETIATNRKLKIR